MTSKSQRDPNTWVRRRPRALGPGGRFVRDSTGNAVWVRTRATDPPMLVIDPVLLHLADNSGTASDIPGATDHLLPVMIGDSIHRR